MHLCLNGNQIWTAGIRAPRSMTHIGFQSPPAFLPLSGGGGSGIEGAPLQWSRSKHPDQWPTRIPDPPAFLPLSGGGGGGPESRMHLFNGHDRSARINGAQGDSDLPYLSTFNQNKAPFPVILWTILPPLPSVLLLTIHEARSL
jgi:hypothetical protein